MWHVSFGTKHQSLIATPSRSCWRADERPLSGSANGILGDWVGSLSDRLLRRRTGHDPLRTNGPFAARSSLMTEHTGIHVRRADHVGFAVASLDEALRFWVDGLGARLVRTGEMGGEFLGQVTGAHGAKVRMAIVSLPDQTIELLEYQGSERPSEPAKPFDPGFAQRRSNPRGHCADGSGRVRGR